MPRTQLIFHPWRRCLTGLVLALALALLLPAAASAQVVVVANGSPITAYDIDQRTKLLASSTHKTPPRQEVIDQLIDDRLKIAKAKIYGLEVTDADINKQFAGMAERQHIPIAQFDQMLARSGISPNTVKARIRAEMTWNQLVRGKFGPSLEVGEADIASALRARNETEANSVAAGYIYTLYPIMVVMARDSSPAVMAAKRREAEALRGQFVACKEGLAYARALRDVAVREPVTRSIGQSAATIARSAGRPAARSPDPAGGHRPGSANVRAVRKERTPKRIPRSSVS